MPHTREHYNKKHYGSQGSVASMFISLYLVVFAFFILLNAISSRDAAKEEQVMGSVQQRFANSKEDATLPGIEFTRPTGAETFLTGYFNQIKKLVAMDSIAVYEDGNSMQIILPSEALFVYGSAEIIEEKKGLIKELSQLVMADMQKLYTEVELSIPATRYLVPDQDANVDGLQLEIARSGAFARAMIAEGVAPGHIVVGVIPEPSTMAPDILILSFYIRVAEEAGTKPEVAL